MNKPVNFKKRLLQMEAPVDEGLLTQVFARRMRRKRRKRSRLLRLGIAGVVGTFLLVGGWFFFRPVMLEEVATASQTEHAATMQPEAKNPSTSAVPIATAEPSASGQAFPPAETQRTHTPAQTTHAASQANRRRSGTPKQAQFRSLPFDKLLTDAVPSEGSWTVYPPLSALQQSGIEDWKPVHLNSQVINRLLSGTERPQPSERSSMYGGRRITTNTWLFEVMTEPAWMQVRAANPAYNQLLHQTEQKAGMLQAGIRVGRQLNQQFRWFTGLKYAEQWSRFDWLQQTAETRMLTDVKNVVIKEPGLPDRTISVHDTVMLHSVHHTRYTASNRSRLFSVPVGIQYALQGSGVYVFGSLAPGYVLRSSGMRMQADGSVAFMEDLRFMRRFQLNSEFGLGMRKTLAPGFFFTVEPRLNYGLLNLSKTTSAHHALQLGLNVGISFRPGR
jgi:hypothetical protein